MKPMSTPSVELLYAGDCPNVDAARAQLLRAFSLAGRSPHWREWLTDDRSCPSHLRRYGSPTILVNGQDAAGAQNHAVAASCRVYASADGKLAGVPSVEQIAGALAATAAPNGRWRMAALGGPALAVAFLPKLVCPACWPAYAAAVSALGLTFLLEVRYLLPLTVMALALAVVVLAWQSRSRWGYAPAGLAIAGAVAIVAGKFAADSAVLLYGGAAMFAAAFAWNAWPRRTVTGSADCPKCEVPASRIASGGSHASQEKG